MHYFIGKDGKQLGPFEAGQVRAQLDAGLISPTDLLWREGMPDWAPVSSEFPPAPPPIPPAVAPFGTPSPGAGFPSAPPRAQAGNPFVFNPAPTASATPVLADRGKRLLARLIDSGLMLCAIMPGAFWFFAALGMETQRSSMRGHAHVEQEAVPQALLGLGGGIMLTTLLVLALFIVQMVLLSTKGQTVGKKILGIRIVQLNGSEAGFVHAVLLRAIVMGFINALVGVTSLIDPLCIFREDRRCLHDMIAGTIVIDA